MSENLNLLRRNYCRPGSFTGKRTDHLFPLEEECEEGKALLATAPKTLLHLQEFDPCGLQQTYRDEATGAELPVFAVFDLEGSHQLAFEITIDSLPTTNQPKSLPAYVPFRIDPSIRKEDQRSQNEIRRGANPTLCDSGNIPCLEFSPVPFTIHGQGGGTLCPGGRMGPWRIFHLLTRKPVRAEPGLSVEETGHHRRI